jgi:hypothetical protein
VFGIDPGDGRCRHAEMQMGAALLERRSASHNLAVRAGIFADLCICCAYRFMRPGSLPEESAALGSCVCAPVRSEILGRLAGLHREKGPGSISARLAINGLIEPGPFVLAWVCLGSLCAPVL